MALVDFMKNDNERDGGSWAYHNNYSIIVSFVALAIFAWDIVWQYIELFQTAAKYAEGGQSLHLPQNGETVEKNREGCNRSDFIQEFINAHKDRVKARNCKNPLVIYYNVFQAVRWFIISGLGLIMMDEKLNYA